MACPDTSLIEALHDGELSAADAEAARAHLAECADCRALLGGLQNMSRMLASAEFSEPPAGLGRRMEKAFDQSQRGVLRVASWLSAAAAIVLASAMLTRPPAAPATEPRSTAWETVALMPPAERASEGDADTVRLAQWIADDLSIDERRGER